MAYELTRPTPQPLLTIRLDEALIASLARADARIRRDGDRGIDTEVGDLAGEVDERALAPELGGEEGDVDIIFAVKEKRTGSINFGASVGEGTGVGGFLGLDQPNLFGQCKRASLQWQFGANQKEFSLSFTDPAIQRSRISGTVSVYHRRLRYIVEDYGRSVLSGGSLQFGFPVPGSPFTRVFLSYGGERVEQPSAPVAHSGRAPVEVERQREEGDDEDSDRDARASAVEATIRAAGPLGVDAEQLAAAQHLEPRAQGGLAGAPA